MTRAVSFHIGLEGTRVDISVPPPAINWSSVRTWGAIRDIVSSVLDFIDQAGIGCLICDGLDICFDHRIAMPQMPNGSEIPRRWVITSCSGNIKEGWIVIDEDCLVLGKETAPDSVSYKHFVDIKIAVAEPRV